MERRIATPKALNFAAAVVTVGALFVGPATGSVKTTAPQARYVARVVLTGQGIRLSPSTVSGAGIIVVFKIHNASKTARNFTIGTYPVPYIAPGKTKNYSVGFNSRGHFKYSSRTHSGNKFTGMFVIT